MSASTNDTTARRDRLIVRAALAAAAVAALFTCIVSILLIATHLQLKTSDPLNNPELVALRKQYAKDQTQVRVKEAIRAMDLLARKAYFTSQGQILAGSYLGLGGLLLMFVALGIAQARLPRLPALENPPAADAVWDAVARARLWVAGGGAILAAAALMLAFTTPTLITPDLAEPDAPPTPGGSGTATNGLAPPTPAPAGLPEVPPSQRSVAFRGPNGSARLDVDRVPLSWNEDTGTGIVWKTKVPLPGLSSPIVWGERIFVSGASREKRELYCFAAADGALLWTGTYRSHPNASTDYEVFDTPETLMHAVPTPVTDGRHVAALYANGELAVFEAVTGAFAWSALLGNTEDNMYGLSGSLLVHGHTFIAPFDGDSQLLTAFDAATGEQKWRAERGDATWASPILVQTAGGKALAITHGDPETAAWNPDTGEQVWALELCSGDVAPSPIYAGGRVFVNFAGCGMFAVNADTGEEAWRLEALDEGSFSDAVSMVSDGELVYQFFRNTLSVVDAQLGDIVYEQELDEGSCYASPFIVKDRLYLPCGTTTLVVARGREFKQLAANVLTESVQSSPAVVEGRIYMRGEQHLYCIGEP
jgi:outer membrane protein assembly factor BamB